MRVASSQVVTVGFRVKDSTGVLAAPAALPTAVLYLNGVATAVVVTVSSVAGTGKYKASWTNGVYSSGDQLSLEVTATVGGTSYTSLVWEATVDAVPAASAALDQHVSNLLTWGDNSWATATGFSTSTQVTLGFNNVNALIAGLNDLSTTDIDSRLAAYDAPTKAELDAAFTQIKGATWSAATDTLEALRDRGDAAWTTATGFSTHTAAGAAAAVRTNLATELGRIDVSVSSRSSHTAAAAATAVRTNLATELGRLDTSISSRLAAASAPANFAALGITAAGHVSRVVLVDTTTANTDMRGTDGAALAGSEMNLTGGERAAIAAAVEAAILNDGDGQALVDAIISRIESDLDASDVSVQAIAVAVRDEVFDRVLALNHDIVGSFGRIVQDTYSRVDGLDDRLTQARAEKLDRDLATASDVSAAQAAIISQGNSAWTTATGFSTHTATAAAVAVRSELATELGRIDATVSSRLGGSAAPANFSSLGITPEGHISVVVATPTQTFDNQFGSVLSEVGSSYTLLRTRGDEAWITAVGFATPADVTTALATYDGPTKTEMDAAFGEIKGVTWDGATDSLEAIRSRGDLAWTTATGFATATDLTALRSHGDATWTTATGFTVAADLTALQQHGDATWATATGFAQPGDVVLLDMLQQTPGGSTVGTQLDAAGTGAGGGGGATAAQVWEYPNRTLTSSDLSAADVWNYFVASTGDLAVARIIAAAGGAGATSYQITVTVEDQNGGPVMFARVALADSAVARYTDQFGQTVLYAEPGEYELTVQPPFGFQPVALLPVSVANSDVAMIVVAQRELPSLAVLPGTCAVTLQVIDQAGLPLAGLEVSHKLSSGFAVLSDQWLVNAAAPVVTGADGTVQLVAARGQAYDFTARVSDNNLVTIRRLVPDAASATLSMMVEA